MLIKLVLGKKYWETQKPKMPKAPKTSKPLIIPSTTAKTTTTKTFAKEPEPTDEIPGIPHLDIDGEYVNYEVEEDENNEYEYNDELL